MNKHDEQIEREKYDLKAAVEKFKKQFDDSPENSPIGRKYILEKIEIFATAIKDHQDNLVDKVRIEDYGVYFLVLHHKTLALITLRNVINACVTKATEIQAVTESVSDLPETEAVDFSEDLESETSYVLHPTLTSLAESIGEVCERNWRTLRPDERKAAIACFVVDHYKSDKNRHIQENTEVLDRTWRNNDTYFKLGRELLKLARETNLVSIALDKTEKKLKRPNVVILNKEFSLQILNDRDVLSYLATPVFSPMICPPNDWDDVFGGGYLLNVTASDSSLVKHNRKREIRDGIKRAKDNHGLDSTFKAVNALQKTPWRINRNVYDAMQKALQTKGFKLPHLHNPRDKDERKLRYGLRLTEAARFLDEERIYFPYTLDYRGRAYCQPQTLNYQLDDIGRSLLEFADAKPLGEEGVKWLKIHLANCWGKGEDKKPFSGREDWVQIFTPLILQSAENPIETKWWRDADEPWKFLAACYDWKSVTNHGPDTLSYLPIAVDGTCNGFQHISALRRHKQGAELTNLEPADCPKDLYTDVSNMFMETIQKDAYNGILEAKDFLAAIKDFLEQAPGNKRKMIKMPVLATPYGISKKGIAEYFRNVFLDGHFEYERRVVISEYLAKKLKTSIRKTIRPGTKLMAWFRKIAFKLAKENLPIEWTAPTGFIVVQAEWRTRTRSIPGKPSITLTEKIRPQKLSGIQQALKVVANFIHSLDAAHLVLTINRLACEENLTHFGVVHDSYAVHGCDILKLNRVLREEFVQMHKNLDLAKFPNRDDFMAANKIEFEPPPSHEEFDIEEVLKSEYFFS